MAGSACHGLSRQGLSRPFLFAPLPLTYNGPMSEGPSRLSPKQFSLRALFVVTTIVAILCWAISFDPSLVGLAGWFFVGSLIGLVGAIVIRVPRLLLRYLAQRRRTAISENPGLD